MYDLGIINGRIYMEGNFSHGNLYIKDGIIEKITNEFLSCNEIYDAKNNYVLPGFIDPHVHFNLNCGKYTSVDDFYSGTKAAVFGGVTTIIDFLDPVDTIEGLNNAYMRRLHEAKDSLIDYSFHSTIANLKDDKIEFIKELKNRGISSIKFFTTYSSSNRRTNLAVIDELLKVSKEQGIVLVAHSESDELIKEGPYEIEEHSNNRPVISEIVQTLTLAEMAKYRDGLMYIVHLSCGSTLGKLLTQYEDILNKNLFIESCPQYFYLGADNYNKPQGYLYTLSPPLRTESEQVLLKTHIDRIDTIGTDHCTFYSKDKINKLLNEIPMGIGGIEYSFRLMYSLFGDKIIDKFTINPAKIYGLYPKKGTLIPGAQGDIVIFNPSSENYIKENHSNCDYNLYEGVKVRGTIEATISKGIFVMNHGKLINEHRGEYIERSEFQLN